MTYVDDELTKIQASLAALAAQHTKLVGLLKELVAVDTQQGEAIGQLIDADKLIMEMLDALHSKV